jgi:hypothetical protein
MKATYDFLIPTNKEGEYEYKPIAVLDTNTVGQPARVEEVTLSTEASDYLVQNGRMASVRIGVEKDGAVETFYTSFEFNVPRHEIPFTLRQMLAAQFNSIPAHGCSTSAVACL